MVGTGNLIEVLLSSIYELWQEIQLIPAKYKTKILLIATIRVKGFVISYLEITDKYCLLTAAYKCKSNLWIT